MASSSCSSDIVLTFSVDSVQVVPGLMALAVVLGAVIGVLAAGLLCWFVVLPLLSRKVSDQYCCLIDKVGVSQEISDLKNRGLQTTPHVPNAALCKVLCGPLMLGLIHTSVCRTSAWNVGSCWQSWLKILRKICIRK